MNGNGIAPGGEEKLVSALRALYRKHGYIRYKMSKFETYDLYAQNKDFLTSEDIITFPEAGGKLMALKPDVTLSIVRNSADQDDCVRKVYYNESVYRRPKGSRSFREITQVGLECMGDVDDYCVGEVLYLAAKSLLTVSEDCVLAVSHLGIVSDLLDRLGLNAENRTKAFACISGKNLHELSALLENAEDRSAAEALRRLVTLSGEPAQVLAELRMLGCRGEYLDELTRLTGTLSGLLPAGLLTLDFSVANDARYYTGVVFKGFVSGVPSGVLAGGRYDPLMKKMGKRSGAIGFAVYLDALERLTTAAKQYDVDTLLLYDEDADPADVFHAVEKLSADGTSVLAERAAPEKLRCRRSLRLKEVLADG